jgi:hypothetical protein
VAPPAPAPVPAAPEKVAIAEPAKPVPLAVSSPTRTAITEPAPAPAQPTLNYFSYTARWITVDGEYMRHYASTLAFARSGSLFTHGFAYGRQGDDFRNAVYFGFGTEYGGGTDTLRRYELSWQFLWTPLGVRRLVSPHLGFRLGGMAVSGQVLTGDSARDGLVIAPMGGVDVNVGPVVLTAGLGYDAILNLTLARSDAGVSGWSIDGGASIRF